MRGRFKFWFDELHPEWISWHYQATDPIDLELYRKVGGGLLAEAQERSRMTFYWTDWKIGIVGILIALLAATLGVFSVLV